MTPDIADILKKGEFEGLRIRRLDGDIEPGDSYLAQRNTGVKLLTCQSNNHDQGWINPVENAYPYDTWECVRIEILLD